MGARISKSVSTAWSKFGDFLVGDLPTDLSGLPWFGYDAACNLLVMATMMRVVGLSLGIAGILDGTYRLLKCKRRENKLKKEHRILEIKLKEDIVSFCERLAIGNQAQEILVQQGITVVVLYNIYSTMGSAKPFDVLRELGVSVANAATIQGALAAIKGADV